MVSMSGSGGKSPLDEAGKIWEEGWWGRRRGGEGLGEVPFGSVERARGFGAVRGADQSSAAERPLAANCLHCRLRGARTDWGGAPGRKAHLSRAQTPL